MAVVKAEMPNGAVAVPLRHGETEQLMGCTLVDWDDVEVHCGGVQWRLNGSGYVVRWKDGTTAYLHREILGLTKGDGLEVDHINRDRLDNRRENLRIVTRKENGQNLPPQAGTSKYRGVCWDKRLGRWTAQVKLNRRKHGLGSYETEEEAAKAAAAFRREHMSHSEEASCQ